MSCREPGTALFRARQAGDSGGKNSCNSITNRRCSVRKVTDESAGCSYDSVGSLNTWPRTGSTCRRSEQEGPRRSRPLRRRRPPTFCVQSVIVRFSIKRRRWAASNRSSDGITSHARGVEGSSTAIAPVSFGARAEYGLATHCADARRGSHPLEALNPP